MTSTQSARANRLIHSTSPYLLQHAHNPVDWYPWGTEALQKAKVENKPIFLSIGYSACHWCHVMERESFENPAIAAVLNEHFVSIKVDREERPDLDEIYMTATVMTTGSGGWPMSVFLTPDQKPFFAGTYFPPESRYGRIGFRDLLSRVTEAWQQRREAVESDASRLADALREYGSVKPGEEIIPRDLVTSAAEALAENFDRSTGGLLSGQTNKFPPSMAMALMLREYQHSTRSGKPRKTLLDMVELTLDHMARGGIYDHLGGGIARYSTDPQWLVPHFEKMLYDQALVSGIYVEAFQLTRNARYADVARDIFDYVLADLRSPEGGFYSARDADSEGVEGKFYVWSRNEVLALLGDRDGDLFCSYYDVTTDGNWEGHNILNIQRDLQTVAKLNHIEPDELKHALSAARRKLLDARSHRVPPHLDDKVLTSWNGLMVASMARGGRILGDRKYTDAAAEGARFVLKHISDQGRLLRTFRRGKAHTLGYLDDYAFFVEALLELYEATFDRYWLSEAIRLNDDMIRHFWDERDGAFFFSADDAEKLLVRTRDGNDGAIPSGNSVGLLNLLRLGLMLDRSDLRSKAELTMKAFVERVRRSPLSFDRFLQAVAFYHALPVEVAIVGSQSHPATQALIRGVDQVYDPARVVMCFDPSDAEQAAWAATIPLLAGKTLVEGKPAAYVCRNYTCRKPVTTADELIALLTSVRPTGSSAVD